MGQTDALEVSGGVDLLEQLRELRLEHVHLRHTAGEQLSWFSLFLSQLSGDSILILKTQDFSYSENRRVLF